MKWIKLSDELPPLVQPVYYRELSDTVGRINKHILLYIGDYDFGSDTEEDEEPSFYMDNNNWGKPYPLSELNGSWLKE